MTARHTTKGHTSKHVTSRKHHATTKHHATKTKSPAKGVAAKVHTVGKHATHAKARGFAVGDLLPVCAVEAVAMSLRLAGQPVHDDEVAWLWELSGARELTIAESLAAAAQFGLAGRKPLFERRDALIEPFHEAGNRVIGGDLVVDLGAASAGAFHAPILGVDRPGPHAVLATPDGWWSWGALHSPWDARVEEAWEVSWS